MAQLPDLKSLRPAFELADGDSTPPMVTFEQPNGDSEAFCYDDLRSVRYQPDGLVKVRFADALVDASGRNLLPVWRALRSRRVRLLRVGSEAEGIARTGNEPHIERITITPSPRREKSAAATRFGHLRLMV